MFKILLQVFLLALLVASSHATFKKRKGNKKGEDTAAQGSSHGGGKPSQAESPHRGEYQQGGGYQGEGPYRREPHGEGYPSHGYRGGDDDDEGYRPSHGHPHRGPHHNEGYSSGPGPVHHGPSAGGFRREHDNYRGEPSNHGINYIRGEPYSNYHSSSGPQQIPGHRPGASGFGGPPRTGYRGVETSNDGDEKRRYSGGGGGPEYDDSDEEDMQGQGWVGIHGTTSNDGSTKANQTEGAGTGRLGNFFSRTRSGIKRLLKLS